jgi:phosphatidate cytidylyltransferase
MRRLIPGLVLAVGWLLLLLSNYFVPFWIAVVIISLLAGHEYLKMIMPRDVVAGDMTLLTVLVTFPVVTTGLWLESGLGAGLFFSIFLSVCYILANYSKQNDSLDMLGRQVFGTVYVGFLLAHLLLIWHLPEGNMWLIILVAVTAGSDSGAYYCGRLFGKNKLCRYISPNKTIEGALGGLFCGVSVALIIAWIFLGTVNWLVLIPVAVLLTGVGIIGDLCESVIKRGTNTKDSGTILFGHGGILDRIDSMILSAPFLFYLLMLTY